MNAAEEPHHRKLLDNAKTRVFVVELQPGESSEFHRHEIDFVAVALSRVIAENETEKTVRVELSPGEIQVVKTPLTHRITNRAEAPYRVLHVEVKEGFHPAAIVCGMGKKLCPSEVGDLTDPRAQFTINRVFETDTMRVTEMTVGPGATTPTHQNAHQTLRVPMTEANLEISRDEEVSKVLLKPGEVAWVEPGVTGKIANSGQAEARWYEIEFK